MKRKLRKLLCILCISLGLNSLVAAASDAQTDAGTTEFSNRKQLLVLTPGDGEGQLGYGGNSMCGYMGPDAFVVEDDTIYILDYLNQRIVVWKDGTYSHIDISGESALMQRRGLMYHEDGSVTATAGGMGYLNFARKETDSGAAWILDRDTGTEWTIDAFHGSVDVVRVQDGELVYLQYEKLNDTKAFFTDLVIRKIDSGGKETWAYTDFKEWYFIPANPVYVSDDGRVYLMDCLDDRIVISEVFLGTTEKSRLEELYVPNERNAAGELNENSKRTGMWTRPMMRLE